MTNNRDVLIDQIKGYACILVAFGHVIMGIRKSGISTPYIMKTTESFIWTFHVALFMFLSGYVFYITGGWKSKGGKSKLILHKFINLGIPYFVFSIIYILINSSISSVNNSSNIRDIFLLWEKPVAQYWFLYALFYLFVIWTVFSNGTKKNNAILTMLCFCISVYVSIRNIKLGIVSSAVSMAFAFGMGSFLKIDDIKLLKLKNKMMIILIHIVVAIVLIKNGMESKPVIDEILAVFGICCSIMFISEICKNRIISKILLTINRYSFPIYLLHTIFTAGIRIVLAKLEINIYIIHLFIGMLFAIVGPYLCMKIAERNRYLEFLFYPGKILKIRKNK